ncbi:hypothetical protein ACFL96_15800 [Thermoproteota archaeon]
MDFLPPPSDNKVLAFGIGTAGCRILSYLENTDMCVDNYVSISCDKQDLEFVSNSKKMFLDIGVMGNRTPSHVRGATQGYMNEIRRILNGTRLVFLVSGLGGCTGSGLTPLISKIAKEEGVITINVAITPFGFEKSKHFYTGTALKNIKKNSDAVIIVDNDMIFSDNPQMSISKFYSIINERISVSLSGIIESSGELNVGINKLIDTITNHGYSVLSIGTSSSINKAEDATVRAVKSVYDVGEPEEVKNAILHLIGDKNITANEIVTSTSRLNTMLGTGSLEVHQGFNANGGGTMTAILLTSGFKTTKFDNYDPIDKALHNNQMDSDMDCGIDTELSELVQME